MSKKLILSIDGGGALGVGPAQYLAQLEREYGPLGESAIAGTSTGGLLTLLRAIGMSWVEIEVFFNKGVEQVFHPTNLLWRENPWDPKWMSDGIEALCHDVFGERKCKDVEIPFFVTASNMTTGTTKVFDTTDDTYLYDVALCTSAAPTFFVARVVNGTVFVDGGLWANNPSNVALTSSKKKLGIQFQDQVCLSMATGGNYWVDPKLSEHELKLQLVTPLINYMLHGTEEGPAYQAAAILDDNYYRVGPNDGNHDFEMDDLSILPQFKALWATEYTNHGDATKLLLAQTK